MYSTIHYRSARKHKDGSGAYMNYLWLEEGICLLGVLQRVCHGLPSALDKYKHDKNRQYHSLALVRLLSKRKRSLSRDCSS